MPMKVILTGITGNLGYEVALDLLNREVEVIPLLRDISRTPKIFKNKFNDVIENDLENDSIISLDSHADLILHCAGNVHLKRANGVNENMTQKVITLAQDHQIPLYFVSTAFVYRPPNKGLIFNNNYEMDKYRAEQAVINSEVEYAIFRPSVLVGNSKSGEIQNFTGYYSLVKALLQYANSSKRNSTAVRIPKFRGYSDIIPVDQVAKCIGNVIEEKKLGEFFITTSQLPKASWVFEETINFFGINELVNVLDCTYEEFGELELTDNERRFYEFCKHFKPYWSIDYTFPNSLCKENLINQKYLATILTYFAKHSDLS